MTTNKTLTIFKKYSMPLLIALGLFGLAKVGFADITTPTLPDGSAASDNFIGDMGKVLKGAFQLGIYALLAGGWLVAGYLIIQGAIAMFQSKGGAGQFFMGIFVAFVMVLAMTYFLDKGETALDDIGVSSLYQPASITSIA